MESPIPTPDHHPKQESWGALIAIIIIVALIFAGSFYFFLKGGSVNQTPAVGAVRV